MSKRSVKFIFILLISLIFFMPNKTKAADDYTITKYNIDMVVNEDNTYDITENITAYFNIPRHGIYRKIPLKNNIQREDGSSSNNNAKITDITVSENYTDLKLGEYQILTIGDVNETLKGEHTYTIKYKYDIGKDPLKNADELYFNLIGDEWDTSIENVDFQITMPKEFDSSKLGFSIGKSGTTETTDVVYNVRENTITGYVTKTLDPGESVRVRCVFPERYFIIKGSDWSFYSVIVVIFSIVCVVIAYEWWRKYRKTEKVLGTVEFYPPEGYNSAEVGVMYKGAADDKSVISLLIYLADKGYLKIEETNETEFKIIKLKDYDGDKEIERIFFEGLFKDSIKKCAKNIMKKAKKQGEDITEEEALDRIQKQGGEDIFITSLDLYDNFYKTLDKIKNKFDFKKNKNKIFNAEAKAKIRRLVLMAFAIYTLIVIKPVIDYYGAGECIMILIFAVIGFTAFACIIMKSHSDVSISGEGVFSYIGKIIVKLSILIPFVFLPWFGYVFLDVMGAKGYMSMNMVGIVSIIIIAIFASIIPKRTDFGNKMLGKVIGFKKFLETAEKEKLETLVEENPEYFYNILPYTYALGISDKWMRKFELMAFREPYWHSYYGTSTIHNFNRSIKNTMQTANRITRKGRSHGSSSSGGGGFSGGGSGGGRRRLLVNSINA